MFGESLMGNPEENEAIWQGLSRMMSPGNLRPMVTRSYTGLESVSQALQDLASRKILGKAVVVVDPSPASW